MSAFTQSATASRPPRRNRRESIAGLMGSEESSDDVPGYTSSSPTNGNSRGGIFGGIGIGKAVSGGGSNNVVGGGIATSFTNRRAAKSHYDQKGSIVSRLTKATQGFSSSQTKPTTAMPTVSASCDDGECGDFRKPIQRTNSLRQRQANFRNRVASMMPRIGMAQNQQANCETPSSPNPTAASSTTGTTPNTPASKSIGGVGSNTPSPSAKPSPGSSSVGSSSNNDIGNSGVRPMMSMRNLNMNLPAVNLPKMNVNMPKAPTMNMNLPNIQVPNINMEVTLPDLSRFGSGFSRGPNGTGGDDEPQGAGWGALNDSGVFSLGGSGGSEVFSPIGTTDLLDESSNSIGTNNDNDKNKNTTATKGVLEGPPPPPPVAESTPTTTSSTIATESTTSPNEQVPSSFEGDGDGTVQDIAADQNLFEGSQNWADFDQSFTSDANRNNTKGGGDGNGDNHEDEEDDETFNNADYTKVPDFRKSESMPAQFTPAARFATAAESQKVDIAKFAGASSLLHPPLDVA